MNQGQFLHMLNSDNEVRHAAKQPLFTVVDYRISFLLLFYIFDITSVKTLLFIIFTAVVLWLLQVFFGWSLPSVGRRIGAMITGKHKPALTKAYFSKGYSD